MTRAPGARAALILASVLAASPALAGPAAERTIELAPREKARDRKPATTQPRVRPRIPAGLDRQIRARMDARVERDLVEIRGLRAEAIDLLGKFIAEAPAASRELPEALMRLGELRWEIAREEFLARFKAWEGKPRDTRGPTPEPSYGPARELFLRVLRDHPTFPSYDLALYVDGFLATEQGKPDEALDRFGRILRDFPRSRFAPDAHMAKAEALFNSRYDYGAALAEYEEVLRHKDSELYGLALFKSAWCLWRLGRTDEAARRFIGVFEVDGSQGRVSATRRRELDELQAEALKYLVEVFTEDEKNTAGDVYGFLVKIGGDRFAGKVVRALAEQFYEQAHYERGIEAYELLLKLEPGSRDAGAWMLAIATGWATVEDWPRLRATYERALVGYTQGSAWAKGQADPAWIAATTRAFEGSLRDHAVGLHAKAQRDRTSRAEFEGAASLYEAYLGRFGGEPGSWQIHYYLAEIQFYHLDRGTDAAQHYMQSARTIADADASREPGRALRHDAIYNAVAALERVRLAEVEGRTKQPGATYVESEADRKLAEALELYAQLYPSDPALPELLFRQGRTYYDQGAYDPAVRIWGSLLERFPRSQYAQGAGELILDSFSRARDHENIEAWARRLKRATAFASEREQRRLDALIVQAVFKQGEQRTAAGEHDRAAKAYLRAAQEFPRDARAAQACVNAILAAQRAGDTTTLREAALLVTSKDYQGRPESPRGAWTAATAFQAMGLYAESAEVHESILALADKDHPSFAKFEHTRDAGYNAVVLREATGEHDRAVANGTRFLAAYPQSREAVDVVFHMGRAHQAAGRNKEAVELYRRFVGQTRSVDRRVQGLVLLALAQIKLGDERGAFESLREAAVAGKQKRGELSPEGRHAAARARYMEGERVLARFEEILIAGDVKQLSARLKRKAELLKQASLIFLDTVSMGVAEWTTAALYQIGRTYEGFARSLKGAPPPTGLSDADREAYQQEIDAFAVPIEERALDAYENGWKKAVELGIYNQWTAKMRESLGRLNAELYPPLKETGIELRSQGPSALPGLLDAPLRGGERGGRP